MISLFINTILHPPSFNEWQAMSSTIDMLVVAVGFITRQVWLVSLSVVAFFLIASVIINMKSIWKPIWKVIHRS